MYKIQFRNNYYPNWTDSPGIGWFKTDLDAQNFINTSPAEVEAQKRGTEYRTKKVN